MNTPRKYDLETLARYVEWEIGHLYRTMHSLRRKRDAATEGERKTFADAARLTRHECKRLLALRRLAITVTRERRQAREALANERATEAVAS